MNILLKALAAITLAATPIAIGQCCNTFDSISEKKFKEAGWSQEQAEVGTAVAYRKPFTEETKHEDGTATYKLNLGGITEEDVLLSVKSTHRDLEEALEYRSGIPMLKYFQKTGLGQHFEKQELVYRYLEDTLSRKLLHKKFIELSQQTPSYPHPYDPLNVNPDDRYSITTIFPLNQKEMKFDMEYVESARASGKLKDPSSIVESVLEHYFFFEKVKNPRFPKFDKYNEWIFEKRAIGARIISYNLDNDKELEADYVELFRIIGAGKPESLPAVKVFKPNGTGSLEIVVADTDIEGTPGYGMPDLVDRIPVSTGSDLLSLGALEFIFESAKDKPFIPDTDNPSEVYIVRAGTLLAEKYDIEPAGWESYLPNYRSGMNSKKFSVHIKLAGDDEDKARKIDWIAKQYSDQSRAVEFYRPNETFKEESYQMTRANGNLVSIMDKSGQLKQYNVDAIIEEKPFRIDFDRSGFKRWVILDKDNDREHYEAKREVSWTSDIIPK